ncbi:hypothetical protein E2C01_034896 [Portunus trituberculatus]|uniref:Uncharacterized protein n=1 Tax=Portunus trituberculatus TaxID=210409 RepID=A0A5B7F865_PORTR|nr:hypothetical protein [Portunus trituberculatus]
MELKRLRTLRCWLFIFNPFSTGMHFYRILLYKFIDIRKCLWRSEDEWPDSSLF